MIVFLVLLKEALEAVHMSLDFNYTVHVIDWWVSLSMPVHLFTQKNRERITVFLSQGC